MNNSKWTTINTAEKLEQYLIDNPDMFIYDRRQKEMRFMLSKSRDVFGILVDGRSVRVLRYKLSRTSSDGGLQLEIEDCPHKYVWPDGACTHCGRLVTAAPGLSTAHVMVPRKPEIETLHKLYEQYVSEKPKPLLTFAGWLWYYKIQAPEEF